MQRFSLIVDLFKYIKCTVVGIKYKILKHIPESRYHMPFLLYPNKYNYLRGAEIGVQKGSYSEYLLDAFDFKILYSVDPWKHYPDAIYMDRANLDQKEQDENYQTTLNRLARFKKRSCVLRMTSCEANKLIPGESLDFIHIDANHKYEYCAEDILIWYSKLKKGGILSGHDYILMTDMKNPNERGVKRAVDEFVSKNNLQLFFCDKVFPCWYFFKK